MAVGVLNMQQCSVCNTLKYMCTTMFEMRDNNVATTATDTEISVIYMALLNRDWSLLQHIGYK
jgi:hypothetical protein